MDIAVTTPTTQTVTTTAAPAPAKKRACRAVVRCSKCGKKFYGARRNSKLGSHTYAAHTKKAAAAASTAPAFGVAATLKILEAQRDKLNRAIEVLKAI